MTMKRFLRVSVIVFFIIIWCSCIVLAELDTTTTSDTSTSAEIPAAPDATAALDTATSAASISIPGTPALQVKPDGVHIIIAWTSSTPVEDVKGYEVSRSTDGTTFSAIMTADTEAFTTTDGSISWTDKVGLASGKYYYSIRAYDKDGIYTSPSEFSEVSVNEDFPDVPVNLSPLDYHGNYVTGTQRCSSCHSAHSAKGPHLITADSNNDQCLICHNGTQAPDGIAVNNGSFSYSAYNSDGHYETSGSEISIKSDCTICHNPHGSQNPRILNGSYAMNVDYSRTGPVVEYDSACVSCHTGLNGPAPSGTTKFNDNGKNLHYLHLQELGQKGEGNAVCYECHRPHGSIAQEIGGTATSNALVGFPSLSVKPGPDDSGPIYYPTANGGGCSLTCHGAVHTTDTAVPGETINSSYVNKP